MLGGLALSGELKNTLVVLTADHGESLTEHREYLQHGWFLYDTTVRVPLIFSLPGVIDSGRVSGERVSTIDILPTVAELAGIRLEEGLVDGRSLLALAASAVRVEARPGSNGAVGASAVAVSGRGRSLFSVGPRANHPFAMFDGSWKLIMTPAGRPALPRQEEPPGGFATPRRVELYDLSVDPAELDNVAGDFPERTASMSDSLAVFRERWRRHGWDW